MKNNHPKNCYDLSAILFNQESIEIIWPKVKLKKNQFLVAYRGEAASDLFPNSLSQDSVWAEALNESPWKDGIQPGIYRVAIASRQQVSTHSAPFVLNAMVRFAHFAVTGTLLEGWKKCSCATDLYYYYLAWITYEYWNADCFECHFYSSFEQLSSFES